jgi:hypothetical protein
MRFRVFEKVRTLYSSEIQPGSKPILAQNVLHSHLSRSELMIINSLLLPAGQKNILLPYGNSFAIAVKGDRVTIRQYLNGQRSGQLYRKQWKLTTLNFLWAVSP